MSYQKFLVDNVTCSRRFHITYDSSAAKVPYTEVRCSFCNVVIFAEAEHPPVHLARQENLVQTASLSDNIVRECHFKDAFAEKSEEISATT